VVRKVASDPAVSVRASPAPRRQTVEPPAADDADQEEALPAERLHTARRALDELRVAAEDAEALVQRKAKRDYDHAEDQAPEPPRRRAR
jgi:hypothetical protein